MNEDQHRPRAEQSKHHEHERPVGAESPHNLLAVHDPSKRGAARGRQTMGGGHGVTVQWLRPTELAARIAARTAAGAVAAHVAAHRHVRDRVRVRLSRDDGGRQGRLAPLSAFGRHAETGPARVERSVVGR